MENVLEVKRLSVHYNTYDGDVRAVDGADLVVPRGRSLGLIGESGCGKSSMAQSMMRLLRPPGRIVGGQVLLDGDDLLTKSEKQMESIRWRKVALVPQGAMNSLNPVYTIGQQICEAITVHEKVTGREAWERASKVLDMVGIDSSRLSSYPHEFSGGMKQRVAIAMALVCQPSLIIADESTNGLDVITQAQVLSLVADLRKSLNMSFMMISHDLHAVRAVCDLIAVMYAGKVVEVCAFHDFRRGAVHPYSRALSAAFLDLRGPRRRIESIPGQVPSLIHPPSGCRFHPRCPSAMSECADSEPPLVSVGTDHSVACHLAGSGQHGLV